MVAFSCLLLFCMGCRAEPVPLPERTVSAPQTVTIGLTSSAASLPTLLDDSLPVNVTPLVSNGATLYADLDTGALDAILVHTLPPEIERSAARWFNPVALDGLTFIVHPDNTIADLSLLQLQAIFSGKIDNWAQVGGPQLPIEVVSREIGSGARTLAAQRVMAEQRLTINAVVQPSSDAVGDYVAAHPGAIGYVMMGGLADFGGAVRFVTVEGVAPTPQSTADQSYPLTVPLFFVNLDSAEPQGSVRDFLAYLQSAEGQMQLSVRYGRVR